MNGWIQQAPSAPDVKAHQRVFASMTEAHGLPLLETLLGTFLCAGSTMETGPRGMPVEVAQKLNLRQFYHFGKDLCLPQFEPNLGGSVKLQNRGHFKVVSAPVMKLMDEMEVKTIEDAINIFQELKVDKCAELGSKVQCVVAIVGPNEALVVPPGWISVLAPVSVDCSDTPSLGVEGCFGLRCSFWPSTPLDDCHQTASKLLSLGLESGSPTAEVVKHVVETFVKVNGPPTKRAKKD